MNKEQRVAAIIAAKSNAFTDADKPFLLTASEDLLKRLEGAEAPKPAPAADDSVQPKPQTPPTVENPNPTQQSSTPEGQRATEPTAPAPKDAAGYIATMPTDLQEAMRDALKVRTARRTELMTVIKAAKTNTFTDAQLEAKSTEELEQLSTLVGGAKPAAAPAVDYSGLGLPVGAREAADANKIPDAPSVIERIAKLRERTH